MRFICVQHLPFDFPGEKKAAFGLKLFVFMASGFSIPFLAAAYQLLVSFAVENSLGC